MRITELLKKDAILLGAAPKDKNEAIDILVGLHAKVGNITDKAQYKAGILEREEEGTTAIGEGIAIPHSKNAAVKKAGIASMTVPAGVDYDSMDGEPSNLFFMIAAPKDGADVHLDALARLSTLLMDTNFRTNLLAAKNADEYLKVIDKAEKEKFGEEEQEEKKEKVPVTTNGYRVLAVTACPTGIAHTYMAAEALETKGKELGILVKAETQGSGGAKNILTREEIEAADGIIIAADKNVDLARFDGKKVLRTKVADGIHKPEELIQRIVDGDAPVYHHSGSSAASEEQDDESVGRKIYKHLMNGVSHMLPFVIGGGILIAIAFLLDDPNIDPSNFGKNTPVAAFFKTIGDTAFGFMLPILAGYIAMSIADRPALAAGFIGGTLASSGITFTNLEEGMSAGFIGALFAGFLAGYLMVGIRKLCDHLPSALEGIKPTLIYPVLGVLLMGAIMCAVNPFFAMLNNALTNGLNSMGGSSKILLGCILGGMMSIDMGGPFNKAAYVFGTAAISNGDYDIMAAVMIGGMVPPIAIALCTTFFKNRFTENERKSGVANYVMGLCFITEGAIPFAASDPLHVLPSCIVGSAVAGGISMAMGCTLRAPHGGVFVFPVVGNVVGYVIALIIGSLIAMVLLAILKKPLTQKK
ncbi:MAG TPA: PTS sugar transporter subunit IIA [Candidatus Fimimorpha faecalis]|uniref:PTS sugar transporter subunit IIA n=1 Tax=Candidatus Fimimorpha faecalis TaxID=2840824 RepID=A0A9D1ED05_9FIRM|nr:PTS sugar transporter subunit IIA [Candidatus Fimimorpha faecalis]